MRFTLRPNTNDETVLDWCLESEKGATKPFCWVQGSLPKEMFTFTPDSMIEDIEHWIEQQGYYEWKMVGVNK